MIAPSLRRPTSCFYQVIHVANLFNTARVMTIGSHCRSNFLDTYASPLLDAYDIAKSQIKVTSKLQRLEIVTYMVPYVFASTTEHEVAKLFKNTTTAACEISSDSWSMMPSNTATTGFPTPWTATEAVFEAKISRVEWTWNRLIRIGFSLYITIGHDPNKQNGPILWAQLSRTIGLGNDEEFT